MASASVWVKIKEQCSCKGSRNSPCIYCRALASHGHKCLRISRMDRIIRNLCQQVREKDRIIHAHRKATASVLEWWKVHEFDSAQVDEHDERNVYDEDPPMVVLAKAAMAFEKGTS